MTIKGTLYPQVVTELKTRLEARSGLNGIQVLDHKPVQILEATAIWFGDPEAEDEEISFQESGGMVGIIEETDFPLIIQVTKKQTQALADADVAAWMGEVIEELAENPTLGGNVAGLHIIKPFTWRWARGRLPEGMYATACELSITFRGELTATG